MTEDATPLSVARRSAIPLLRMWEDEDDEPHIAWVRGTEQALRPWSAGRVSLNFVSEIDNDRVRSAFGEQKYRRLVALKDKYDPTNVFRMNQNVRPSAK